MRISTTAYADDTIFLVNCLAGGVEYYFKIDVGLFHGQKFFFNSLYWS